MSTGSFIRRWLNTSVRSDHDLGTSAEEISSESSTNPLGRDHSAAVTIRISSRLIKPVGEWVSHRISDNSLRGLDGKTMSIQKQSDRRSKAEQLANMIKYRGTAVRYEDGSVIVPNRSLPLPSWVADRAARDGLVLDAADSLGDAIEIRPRDQDSEESR